MIRQRPSHRWWTAVFGVAVLMLAGDARCQDIRVRILEPGDGKAIPADALRTLGAAVVDSVPDVALVSSVREATDLIELVAYDWQVDDGPGVRESWDISFRPLDDPQAPPAARARPADLKVVVWGRTADECARKSAERLREQLRPLLERFRPVVLK